MAIAEIAAGGVVDTRKDLAIKYFSSKSYEKGNLGINSLLTNVQILIDNSMVKEKDRTYCNEMLSDIKRVLAKD